MDRRELTVPCSFPDPEDYPDRDEPPEERGTEWRTDERCTHEQCIEIESYRLSRPSQPDRLTQAEVDEIEADRLLMADEFHGRNVAGRIIW